jgi:carboxypeptidase D
MIRLSPAFFLFSLLCGTLFLGPVAARDTSWRSLNAKRLEVAKHWEASARNRNGASDARRAADKSAPSRVKNITFSNSKASRAYARAHTLSFSSSHALPEFYVNGATLPLVNFDVGPSWSGLIPISGAANETRKVGLLGNITSNFGLALLIPQLFFWFFPPGPEGSLDDLIFWYAVYLDAGFVWYIV